MPPADFVFAKFPTEINYTIGELKGKVAESQVDILNDHTEFMNGLQAAADIMESSNIEGAHWATSA